MVLIFVKTPEGHTISVDVKFNASVKYLKKLISRSLDVPRKSQKLIFGGQLLNDEETLDKYNIQKECTVQLITANLNQHQNSVSSTPLNSSPVRDASLNDSYNNGHNTISPYLQFGDLILVQLIEAKELKKCDFWRQSCDPYVILAIDNFTTKSKIIKKNIHPKWNEMFCFVVDNKADHVHHHEAYADAQNKDQVVIGKKIKKKINRRIQKKVLLKGAGSTEDLPGGGDKIGNAGNNNQDENNVGDARNGKDVFEDVPVLSFLVFGHDRFTPDNFLGSTEINLRGVPYDHIIDLWIPLNHIETGHIHVRIRKCLLSSPMHRSIVFRLMSLERSITINDLQKHGISLDQLVGNEAWIHGKHDNLSNPALQHLVNILLSNNHSGHGNHGHHYDPYNNHNNLLWKSSSLKRIQSILSSQHMLPTVGNPTRYIWISGVYANHHYDLFQLINQYVIPKRVYFPSNHKQNELSFALFEFKSIRDAVFILITFQHKKFENSRILLGFGRRLMFDKAFLSDVEMAGFLSIYRNQHIQQRSSDDTDSNNSNIKPNNKWKLCWCFLKQHQLFCYPDLQSDKPLYIISLQSTLLCHTSLQSIEIIKVQHTESSYFIYNHSKPEMACWIDKLQQIINKHANTKYPEEQPESDANEEMKQEEDHEVSTLSLKDVAISNEVTESDQDDKQDEDDIIILECGKCKRKNTMKHMLSTDFTTYFSCISCLRDDILSKFAIENMEYLSRNYSISDFVELLSRTEFSKFLDLKLTQLLETGDAFIECPSCHSQWEFIPGELEHDAPDFNREIGVNNKLLSDEAQKHYLLHRVCCRRCNKNFCRSCGVIPYHSGFNCTLYQTYLVADKCRFCSAALMPDEIAMDAPCEALELVCNSEPCLEKRAFSCRKMHKECGHPCHGTLDEEHCMSCIVDDCSSKRAYIKQESDDYCNICFTEELYEAPCIELDCGHIFHYECIRKRLDVTQYYDVPSVNFAFARCPLCNMRISHNSLLKEELQRIQVMYRDLEQRAYNQLKEDGLLKVNVNKKPQDDKKEDADDESKENKESKEEKDNDTEEQNENENKLNLPKVAYALKRYAFYYCHICKSPYYGGLAQCRDLARGLNASDFVCAPCSGIGEDKCKIHGKDYMVYKCKFCCNVASYFCWGNTHFCIDCHKKQEDHDFMTTKAKKDLPQCPGPEQCPLKIQHPANGEEFSIGCSLCRGTENLYVESTNPPQ